MNKKLIGIAIGMLLFATLSSIAVSTNVSETNFKGSTVGANEFDWWPMYGHDPAHTGFSSSPAPETSNLLLDAQLFEPGDIAFVYSTPAVVDSKLYLSAKGPSMDNIKIICADAFSGEVLWHNDIECAYGTPVVIGDYVYAAGISVDDWNSYLFCLNADNGSSVWQFLIPDMDEVEGSPTVADEKIYFGTIYSNYFYCVNTDGIELWNFSTGYPVISSSAVADDLVYVAASNYNSGPTYIYCLDTTNGSLIWTYTTPKGPGTSTTVVEGKIYVGAGDTMFCLDASGNGDGTTDLLWSFATPGNAVTSCAVAYEYIYFGSNDNKVYCVNATTGYEIWNYTTISDVETPAVADGKVYVGANRKVYEPPSWVTYNYVYCLDAIGNGNGTTDLIWTRDLPCHDVWIRCQPAIAAHTVWIVTDNYYVYGFSDNHKPETPQKPDGPTEVVLGVEYTFNSSTVDPDGDDVSYMWVWNYGSGDEQYSDWSEYVPSGTPISASHSWDELGYYWVSVRARDEIGAVSSWATPLGVTVIEPYPELSIESITGGKGVTAVIKNVGYANAPDVHWIITIDGGIFMQPGEVEGDIETIIAGDSAEINMSVFGIGFGILTDLPTITVTANAPDVDPVEKTATAFVLGPFVIEVEE